MEECSDSIKTSIQPTSKDDPCPSAGSGSFKRANVCKNVPFAYYTPARTVVAFRESIDDLLLLKDYEPIIQKYLMVPKCTISNVPGKSNQRTVLVDKLTPLHTFMGKNLGFNVPELYCKFVSDYLSDMAKFKPYDIWKLISTDFKVDNVMIKEDTNQMFITDFTPFRLRSTGRFTFVGTRAYLLGMEFSDFKPSTRYTTLEISKIAFKMFIITALTTLLHLLVMEKYLLDGFDDDTADNRGYDAVERLMAVAPRTLKKRQNILLEEIVDFDDDIFNIARAWCNMKFPREKRTMRVRKEKSSNKNKESDECEEFIKRANEGGSVIINPFTKRKIQRKGLVFKNILRDCS